MSIAELPEAPDPAIHPREQFSAIASAMVLAQKAMVPQINQAIAQMNFISAGGAQAIPYTYRTSNGLFAAGNGHLASDSNANQSAATQIYLDHTNALLQNVAVILSAYADSTSVVKGYIRIVKAGDPSKSIVFRVTGLAVLSGYSQINGVVTFASSANPFTVNDSIITYFDRVGDKGDTGLPYNVFHLRDERASGAAAPLAPVGNTTRTINATKVNTISGASLASNQITLPAGTYDFYAISPFVQFSGVMFLNNVTDGNVAVLGVPHGSGGGVPGLAILQGRTIIPAPKVFEVRHGHTNGATGAAFGVPVSTGFSEIYLDIFITKGS